MNCPICTRLTPYMYQERHHLVPKCKKGKNYIIVCKDCGDQIHQLFTVKDLSKKYNTLQKLLEQQKIQNWIDWVRTKNFGITMARKK